MTRVRWRTRGARGAVDARQGGDRRGKPVPEDVCPHLVTRAVRLMSEPLVFLMLRFIFFVLFCGG